jgi:hypothetical protein
MINPTLLSPLTLKTFAVNFGSANGWEIKKKKLVSTEKSYRNSIQNNLTAEAKKYDL